ncbi:MFS transporter [Streptomyces sp. CMB-StM0423]|uniref:MFS transporter n=1 Tax=Streptomyces sp. CMB-StM0423 TaxID=2059884 RepID=UPI000C712462|nr:MFS transporter [Streptomyces sp. CMB-StM0423]AUH42751.1 MFS transporter [Streptomyces sp. CMB-StM0423]
MTRTLVPRAYRPVLAHPRLRRLLPAFVASDFGGGMSMVAVAWLAIQIAPDGREGLLVGAALAAYALPGAAGVLLLGRWLRKLPARRLLMVNCALRGTLLGCVPLAWGLGVLDPVTYVVLLGCSSVLTAWGSAGKFTLVGELLPERHRLAANALLGASMSTSIVAGPAVAGFLATAVSPAWIIGLDALTYAVLAVQTARLGPGGEERPDAAAARPAGRGLRLLATQRELLAILVLTWLFFALYGPVEVALPLYVTGALDGDAGLLGLFWTAFGVGAVAGGLTVGALRRLPLWPVTLGIVAGWGATLLLPYGLGAGTAAAMACFALGGAVYGPYPALSFTLFQNRTPRGWLTTVLAARGAVLLTSTPVGAALGGPLVAAFGARAVLAGSGAATVGVAVVGTGVWLATRGARPVAEADDGPDDDGAGDGGPDDDGARGDGARAPA